MIEASAVTDGNRIVAVVEDDASLRAGIVSLLRSFGLRVEGFGSAEEFLGSADVDHVACLIVDLRLPGMTGIELWRRLKTARRALPTVIISAHERPTMSREEASEPVTAFVRKPFAVKALLDAIRGTLAAAGDRFDDDSSRGGSVG